MKKVFLTLALVFATSTVLVSCGDDASKDASEEATPAAEAEETPAAPAAPEAPVDAPDATM